MSPNFALFISQENLRLLIRVTDGWAELGQVSTSAPDMAERLADLRDLAQKRVPTGMATKLIIPNDHIRYMTLAPGQSHDDVMAALDGATPYDVEDLVIDHDTDAGGTHVAAVTREFLTEAERFALDHGLSPVSFVAVPREGGFDREVFFGKTRGAERLLPGGVELGPESEPMTIVPLPPLEPTKPPAPLSFASGRMDAPKDAPTETPAPQTPDATPAATEPAATAPVTFARSTSIPAEPKPETTAKAVPAPKVEAPAPKPVSEPAAKPAAVFASRAKPAPREKADGKAPVLAPNAATRKPVFAHRTAQPAAEPAPAAPARAGLWARVSALLTRVGGTQFATATIGGLMVLALLLGGWLVLRQGADIPTDEVATTEVTAPAIEAAAPSEPTVAAVPTPAATTEGITPLPVNPSILSDAEARRIYAATGVWQKAPGLPVRPRAAQFDLIRPASLPEITPMPTPLISTSRDALLEDRAPLSPPSPPPADQRFALDENGFIAATAEGTLMPSGITVFAGRPDLRPPTRPGTPALPVAPVAEPVAPEVAGGVQIIASAPPRTPPTRPGTTAPQPEPTEPTVTASARPAVLPPSRPTPDGAAAPTPETVAPTAPFGERPAVLPPSRRASAEPAITAGGVSLAGLQRPRLRPEDLEPTVEELNETVEPEDPPSPYAVATSLRPNKRPRNIAALVASARPAPAAQSNAPAVARPLQPTAPTGRTVAARATEENVMRLSQVNLIGVYGSQRNRRALVRLANGRFVKVGVGDQLDGGRVSSIGSDSLQYNRSGRRVTLEIPGQ